MDEFTQRVVLSAGAPVLMADAELIANPQPILYFSKDDFDDAMRGLTEDQKNDAIHHRQAVFLPELESRAVSWLDRLLQRTLRLPQGDAAWKRLDALQGSTAVAALDGEELLELLAEGESAVFDACESGLETQPQAWIAEERDRRERRLRQIAAVSGDDESFLHFTLQTRGYYLSPCDPDLRQEFNKSGALFLPWQAGAMITWPEHSVGQITGLGQTAGLVYWDAADLRRDSIDLTPAQADIRFAERLDAAAKTPAFASYLADLSIAQALSVRAILIQAPEVGLQTLADDDMASLPNLLLHSPGGGDIAALDRLARASAILFSRIFPDSSDTFAKVAESWSSEA